MSRSKGGAGPTTQATLALDHAGVAYTRHSYEHDPSAAGFGLEAASLLGLPPERVFKTLLVDTGARLAVGIVPVDGQLDLKAIAAALQVKSVAMADPAAAERSSGYVVGGISPLGQKKRLATVLDASAEGFPTIFVSGGRRGFDIELAPADLVRLTDAVVAAIGRHR